MASVWRVWYNSSEARKLIFFGFCIGMRFRFLGSTIHDIHYRDGFVKLSRTHREGIANTTEKLVSVNMTETNKAYLQKLVNRKSNFFYFCCNSYDFSSLTTNLPLDFSLHNRSKKAQSSSDRQMDLLCWTRPLPPPFLRPAPLRLPPFGLR